MEISSLSLELPSPLDSVSAISMMPEKPVCIMTLAHGAGAGMEHAFMTSLATALAESGVCTLRFNFPFTENKKGRPDTPAVAHKTIATAIDKARELYPALPLFVAGKSFGGRMSSQYLSVIQREDVKGLIFYGFPLHAAGKPSVERADHLKEVKTPMLFLQGTKDTLATWELIEGVCASLKQATLVKLEGADHSFKAGKKKDMLPVLTAVTRDWISQILS
ncbi:alpha/beta hydrolase family protein [Chitinophaga rhizophila]|uniref:Dienelactone hydrolase family protein n=1 Tax=Chitinophaga rhizophila TaxID=2866212 RepID=A0ABS7G806_9BACT|nr:alpha/beta family hydrolase [Chitinophaga rhizophila]MBW8683586.1 dienelactone hydrolase family protein [Chitinophaga rhizophila]